MSEVKTHPWDLAGSKCQKGTRPVYIKYREGRDEGMNARRYGEAVCAGCPNTKPCAIAALDPTFRTKQRLASLTFEEMDVLRNSEFVQKRKEMAASNLAKIAFNGRLAGVIGPKTLLQARNRNLPHLN